MTLVELIVVMVLLAAIMAIAAPTVVQMRKSAMFRDAARMVANQLQEVRSLAIRDGIAHRIQCVTATGRCELQVVAFNTGTNAFAATALSSYTFPTGVFMKTGPTCATTTTVEIEYFPNGNAEMRSGPATASSQPPATVCVNDESGTSLFMVNLRSLTTGSVEITRP